MAPPCLQPLCRWHVCIKTGMVFPPNHIFVCFVCFVVPIFPDFVSIRVHSCPFVVQVFPVFVFSRVSCVSWFKYSQTSWSIRVHSCPFAVQIFPVFVVHSCPFVSIRGSNIPSFRGPFVSIRVHSCPFVVQVFPDFVFSCVSCVSWFKYSQFSCPFVVQTRGIS